MARHTRSLHSPPRSSHLVKGGLQKPPQLHSQLRIKVPKSIVRVFRDDLAVRSGAVLSFKHREAQAGRLGLEVSLVYTVSSRIAELQNENPSQKKKLTKPSQNKPNWDTQTNTSVPAPGPSYGDLSLWSTAIPSYSRSSGELGTGDHDSGVLSHKVPSTASVSPSA